MSIFGEWFPKTVHNDKLFAGGFTGSMYAQPPDLPPAAEFPYEDRLGSES